MAIQSENIIHSDEKRHKCHYCGSVRYESFMIKLDEFVPYVSSQFGNDRKCWCCKGCYKEFLKAIE